MRPVRDLYGNTKIAEFGPSNLKSVREAMVSSGLSRNVVNSRVNRVRRISKSVYEKFFHDAANRRVIRLIMARWITASLVSGSSS